jgi:hypothetical protein
MLNSELETRNSKRETRNSRGSKVSFSKSKGKSSVNEQVKAGIAALKDFLGGHADEADVPRPERIEVRAEDRGPTAGEAPEDRGPETGEKVSVEMPTEDRGPTSAETTTGDKSEATPEKSAREAVSSSGENRSSSLKAKRENSSSHENENKGLVGNSDQSERPSEDGERQRQSNASAENPAQSDLSAGDQERQKSEDSSPQDPKPERKQQKSVDDVSFDAAVEILRAAGPSAERVDAARALGLQRRQRGTPHLIAAMFDDDPDVRSAAEEALAQIGEPTFKGPTTPKNEPEKTMMQPPSNAQQQTSVAPPAKSVVAQLPKKEGAHAQRKHGTQAAAKEAAPGEKVVHAGASTATTSTGATGTPGSRPSQPPSPGLASEVTQSADKGAEARPADASVEQSPDKAQGATHKLKAVKAEVQTTLDPGASEEEQQLFLEECAIRQRLELIGQQLLEKAAARKESENEAQWRLERESKLLAEAAAQRIKEEKLRKKAEEEAAQRRKQEAEAIAAEQSARAKADAEAERLGTAEVRLRNEIAKLNRSAEEMEQRRTEAEHARLSAAAAARLTDAQRARDEADRMHKAELERLRNEQAMLQAASEKAAARRVEVDAARERAEKDAEALAKAQARMRDAEDSRIKAEAERVKLEAELHLKVETEEALLVAARQRAQEETARLEEEVRRHRESEEKRLADLEGLRKKAELEAQQRAERQQQIRSQLDTLRIADAEVRKRIEDAEVRRRAAEEAFRLVAEKVQRIEAEAHASKLEEEQILSKLEAARKNAAVDAQARADQERRIKEEIEMFRRLEDKERPRLEELILQRSESETRLQQVRERFKSEEEARTRAEERLETLRQYQPPVAEQPVHELTVDTVEVMEPQSEASAVPTQFAKVGATMPLETATLEADIPVVPDIPAPISSYLHSVDPYKRAAAVAELARSQAKDAFALIARCFDDHSPHVRNAAARALRKLEPHKSVDLFNRALEESSAERRKNIGSAIAASGLATEAIDNLVSENREETYNALSILFVMAKTGEVQPLVQAIEEHENEEVCRAVLKLLTLSGQSELGDAALQRRVMGVAASRQKTADRHDEIPDFRLRIAEVEVKRALNSQHPKAEE